LSEKILITIDRDLIHEYNIYYLKNHPTAKNIPFAKKVTEKLYNNDGSPKLTKSKKQATKIRARKKSEYEKEDALYGMMSLNDLLVIQNRMTMNGIKEKWGDLGVWIAKKYELEGKLISNSLVEFRVFSETKANKDLDNLAAGVKFLVDGLFVKSEMYIDDNYTHINPLIIVGEYDKVLPRTEIRISIFDDKIKDVYEKTLLHINNFK